MIGWLSGKIKLIFEDYCILDVHGVGYRVFIDSRTRESFNVAEDIDLFIHTTVREDAITLYGFKTQATYDLFSKLITVSGIGARTALGVLSKISSDELALAIHQKNVNELTKLPGIGKKSAQRLILELKDKIAEPDSSEDFADEEFAPAFERENPVSEATAALTALGYTNAEISTVLKHAKKLSTTEQLVKFALNELNRF